MCAQEVGNLLDKADAAGGSFKNLTQNKKTSDGSEKPRDKNAAKTMDKWLKKIPNGERFIGHKFQSGKTQNQKKPFKNGYNLRCHMNGWVSIGFSLVLRNAKHSAGWPTCWAIGHCNAWEKAHSQANDMMAL